MSRAVQSSRKFVAPISKRRKALAAVPMRCRRRVDVAGEDVSAVPFRIDILQVVDVVHAHIVIVRMRRTAEVHYLPSAPTCRFCGVRIRIVIEAMRHRAAALVEVRRRSIGNIVADMRCFRAADLDVRPRECRTVCVLYVIRVEDFDVLTLDIEFRRLYRTKVQHIARLRGR